MPNGVPVISENYIHIVFTVRSNFSPGALQNLEHEQKRTALQMALWLVVQRFLCSEPLHVQGGSNPLPLIGAVFLGERGPFALVDASRIALTLARARCQTG
jgi:hypothetical protein